MLYFIPAWYQKDTWSEKEQSWHERRMHTEFDDTVKQIQLFHRNGTHPYQIMLLGFTPNFRHFLHRQGVYHAPYWSCFDAIQCVRRRKARLLSYHNLAWPEGIEFIYTMYVIVANLHGKKYAQIEFGEDGNPIRIDLYENGQIRRRNIYDDRGFVSSTIIYENEQPLYQDYLMENGVWKLRHFYRSNHVEINPKCAEYRIIHDGKEEMIPFSGQMYNGLEEVICEVLSSYLQTTDENDLFCAAMHGQHSRLLLEVLQDKKMILSFYEDRFCLEEQEEIEQLLEDAAYIITDSRENSDRIRSFVRTELPHIIDITPYDSRVDFGISSQLSVQNILIPVDDLSQERFEQIIIFLGNYLEENGNVRIHLFTRQAEYDRPSCLLRETRKILQTEGLNPGLAVEEKADSEMENSLEQNGDVKIRFWVDQCVDELAVSRCMREQRILIDLRQVPELYLQISAISMGIPQIVRTGTQFVEHGKNGRIVSGEKELQEAVRFYLDGLKNWNEAVVASYEIGKKFTTQVLLDKWKEVIDTVG